MLRNIGISAAIRAVGLRSSAAIRLYFPLYPHAESPASEQPLDNVASIPPYWIVKTSIEKTHIDTLLPPTGLCEFPPTALDLLSNLGYFLKKIEN